MDFAQNLSFLLYSITSLGAAIFFFRLAFIPGNYYHGLKGGGCLLLAIAASLNLLNHGYTQITFWMYGFGHLLFFLGVTLDKHSYKNLKFLVPLPFLILYFFVGHIMIFLLAALNLIVTIQLAYSEKHKRLIPLIAAFALIAVGEYFYNRTGIGELMFPITAGVFCYIFASLIFLFWLIFYILQKIYLLIKDKS